MKIILPQDVQYILNTLHQHNHQAYIVGGCVRDNLLNKEPKDYDITTSALPEQTLEIFNNHNTIPTGLQHGTITLMLNNIPYEITTFRNDGEYTDNRRPNSVTFTSNLHEDLSRRDFTINSMAYNEQEGLIDPFNGQRDLQLCIIQCVGNPNERFQEDSLRMMRAIRFASRFKFHIHLDTFKAIKANSHLIQNISNERIQSELNQILLGSFYYIDLLSIVNLLQYILPELQNCIDVKQNNPYHIFDVYLHILATVYTIEPTLHLRLTMLLHDIAKPLTKTTDDNSIDHFYGHNTLGADLATTILKRLRYDNNTIIKVRDLILYHDAEIHPTKKAIKRWLNKTSEETVRNLLKVKEADMLAQNPIYYQDRHDKLEQIEILLDEILQEQQCFSKKDLAINGNDLIAMGIKQGEEIGKIIDELVEYVIDNPDMNTKDKLIEYVLRVKNN